MAQEAVNAVFSDVWGVCTKYVDGEGNEVWSCRYCLKIFKGWSATKALHHVAQTGLQSIQACKASIPDECLEQYKNAVSGKGQHALLKKRTAETQESNLDAMQALTTTSLPAKKKTGGGGLVQQSYQDSMCTNICQQMDVALADSIYGDNLQFGFCDSIR